MQPSIIIIIIIIQALPAWQMQTPHNIYLLSARGLKSHLAAVMKFTESCVQHTSTSMNATERTP